MCLEIKNENFKIKIAKKPIICFKLGRVKKNRFHSPFYSKTYYKNMINFEVKLGIINLPNLKLIIINEGYHSYVHFFSNGNQLFLIPKGTKYVRGGINDHDRNNGYVSENIIWLGSKWNPLNWLKILKYI